MKISINEWIKNFDNGDWEKQYKLYCLQDTKTLINIAIIHNYINPEHKNYFLKIIENIDKTIKGK